MKRTTVFVFRSSTDRNKWYETVSTENNLVDGRSTLSCNCPGWTRRVQMDGSRMCVHTRLVETGNPEKDPLFVSRRITAEPELELNTRRPLLMLPISEISASESQRQGFACASFDDMPTRWVDYFKRVGCCLLCGYFHFPELLACSGMRGEPARTIRRAKTRSKPTPEPKAKSLTVAPKRKFSFED